MIAARQAGSPDSGGAAAGVSAMPQPCPGVGGISRSEQDGRDEFDAVAAAWACAEDHQLAGRMAAPVELVGTREHRGWVST